MSFFKWLSKTKTKETPISETPVSIEVPKVPFSEMIDKEEVVQILTDMHDRYMHLSGWVKSNGRWTRSIINKNTVDHAREANAIFNARAYINLMKGKVMPEENEPKTVDSASDDRTANNAVRHKYRVLSEEEKQQMVEIKDLGAAFINKCNSVGKSRELSLAVTNMEQAVMWAVKHVTN